MSLFAFKVIIDRACYFPWFCQLFWLIGLLSSLPFRNRVCWFIGLDMKDSFLPHTYFSQEIYYFPLFSYGWGCLSYPVCSIALSISCTTGLVVMTAFISAHLLKLFFLSSHFPLSFPPSRPSHTHFLALFQICDFFFIVIYM